MKYAVICGLVGLIIGLIFTWVISLMIPTPWNFSQVLIAVGFASFFASFGTALGTKK